jgi:hypothetical protein
MLRKNGLTIILRELIPCRLIMVEVVFSVEPADGLNLAVKSDCRAQGGE